MNGIRLLHFADVHIGTENYGRLDPSTGLAGRLLDFLHRVDELTDYGLAHDVNLVIFAGDAYKRHDPNATYQREFARRVKRLADARVPVVLLVGDHDTPSIAQRASSVDIFQILDVPHVTVARDNQVHLIDTGRGEVQVATMPYPVRQRLIDRDESQALSVAEQDRCLQSAMCEEVQALAGRIDPAMPAVLVGHFSVSGAKPGSEQGTMIGRDATVALSCLANTIWDYVALGHMHTHQDLNAGSYPPVVYSGGVERMGFDEEGQPKGFCWINLVRGRTTWEFIELAARPFVTVCADLRDEASPLMTLQRIIADHDLRDAVVRLILTLRSGQEDLLPDRDVRGLLSEAYFVSAIRRDVVPQTQPHLGELTPEGMADQGLLAEYFRAKRVDPEWAQRLQECAKLIFTPDES